MLALRANEHYAVVSERRGRAHRARARSKDCVRAATVRLARGLRRHLWDVLRHLWELLELQFLGPELGLRRGGRLLQRHISLDLEYMSPEATGKSATLGGVRNASDVFSFGVVLWEMLLGMRVRKAESSESSSMSNAWRTCSLLLSGCSTAAGRRFLTRFRRR